MTTKRLFSGKYHSINEDGLAYLNKVDPLIKQMVRIADERELDPHDSQLIAETALGSIFSEARLRKAAKIRKGGE